MKVEIYKFGLKELKACVDLSDVAFLLDVEPKFLSKQIYKTDAAVKYHSFTLPKKDGSSRLINAPNKNLKFVQSRLSRLLYQCYFDIHGKPEFPGRVISHGFQKQRDLSIYTNAIRHIGMRHVFNVDLEDFFPSFNFGRVRGYFIKNERFALNPTVATVLAQTTCHDNVLPQGAPTSPIISELISQVLDYRLQAVASKYRCTYSRYADDITFSTNLPEFPHQIGSQDAGVWTAGLSIEKAVSSCGLKLNADKTRMQLGQQRQVTTGLTVNRKVNVGRHYYKGVRFCAHAMMTTGKADAPSYLKIPEKQLNSHQIWGMLCHVHDIKGREHNHAPIRHFSSSHPAPHYLRLMRDFFHFHRIHTNPKPVIICEGKTDYIYLKEAIRWNVGDPMVAPLLDVVPHTKKSKGDHWSVDFVRHSDTAGDLLELAGGGGDLPKFAEYHLGRVEKLHNGDAAKPVIIIVDNDSGSEGMWSWIKKFTESKAKIDGSKPYYHVGKNLYVVPIPSGGQADFYIEKLFPQQWLNATLGTKTLKLIQKKGDKLGPNEYGKGEFATKVIRANRGKVDCSSFLPLLHTLFEIIHLK
ncbi:retron Ec67 family RNA-directed DNA polymerase/endonuclease [Rhizobium laguerreae]|uniref:retron Ec67 family RNA-directed DNA polymerase/endonuclease n=1 Tax=Rhizobium laguerreae TaxID=1076926 RepID=UPI001C924141|nr:retron Ec67 family RNA-directed DNA polymerase/endonuclease [Rhizobium laguerreae]MBY3389204.1 RNA-directed DNA polymerase [Rhizobium laguerreae]MBY3402955.1 RNA-directed DNA polymerase [Rhizobium laguerreae]MBY3409894.1 RNA-directed DNA polymerase [Rhizobium laguerreae]